VTTQAPQAAAPTRMIVSAAVRAGGVRPAQTVEAAPRAAEFIPLARETVARKQLPMLRIVCWQLALVSGGLAVDRPWPVATALGVTGAALIGVSAVRSRGQWLSSRLARGAGYLLHRRHHDLENREQDAVLAMFAPGASLGTSEIGGIATGLLSRPGEVVALLRPRSTTSEFVDAAASNSLLPEQDPTMPEFDGQLVLHAGPLRDRPPRAWYAVRVRRDVSTFHDDDLKTALANAVRRTLRRLARANLPADTLSEEDFQTTLAALTHAGSGRGAISEDWRFWRAGPVAQAGFRLTGLPGTGHGPVFGRLLSAAPGTAITIGVTGATTVLRIAATSDHAVDTAAGELRRLGTTFGLRLERLDGQHGFAVAATLPIGGNPL
jgi:type VII secretion protein EccE